MKINKSLTLLITALIIYRLTNISYVVGDDALYNNNAKSLMYGVYPFFSYFFAHPPLFLLLAPLAINIITIRIGLLITQIIILLIINELLKRWTVSELTRTITLGALITTSSFNIFYNSNLGFGLMTMWCLMSYLAYKDGKFGLSVGLAMIASMTRFFALFYILSMILLTYRKHGFKYFIALAPMIFLFIIPLTRYQLFMYHADPGVGKGFMYDGDRLKLFNYFLLMNASLLPFVLLPDYDPLIIAVSLIAGIFMMSNVYFMYTSLITPWLLLALLPRFSDRQIKIIALLLLVNSYWFNTKVIDDTISVNDVDLLAKKVSAYGLPLTGSSAYINLLQYHNGSLVIIGSPSEPVGVRDTLWHRWRHRQPYFEGLINQSSHLFLCVPPPGGYANECNLTDLSNPRYELVEEFNDLKIYRYNI